jgi:hypothetical protein
MRRLASRLSYGNVVSTLALFVALGGSAGAAAAITSRDVRDGSLTSRDIKDHSLRAADLRTSDLPAGPRGPAGEDGEDGMDGMDGADGLDGVDGEDGARGPVGQDAVRLWAVVGGGVLVRHKGVVSVTPGGAGTHTIRFDRDVSACAYGAVVLGTSGTFTTGVTASVTTGLTLGGNDRVAVRTESAGIAVDARVSVTVAC